MVLSLEYLIRLSAARLEQQQLLASRGLVRPHLSARLSPNHRELLSVTASVGKLNPVVANLGLPQVLGVIIQTSVDLKVSVQRLEVAGERFEVIELLLQIRSEEESSNLDPGVGEQAGVERPGVKVRIVVT